MDQNKDKAQKNQYKKPQIAEYLDKITESQLLFDKILKEKHSPLQMFQSFHSDTIYQLWLKWNDIQDISPLLKISLPQLTGLWLRNIKYQVQGYLGFYPFLNQCRSSWVLQFIKLDNNNISSIRQLVHNFPDLTVLDLEFNKISDISPLAKVYLPSLQILDLNNNYINDIEPITKMDWNKLKIIKLMSGSILNQKMIIKIFDKQMNIQIDFNQQNFEAIFERMTE